MNPHDFIPELAAALGVTQASMKFLRYSQNRVYEFLDDAGLPRILRLTEDAHRTAEEIQSELEWLRYLHASGLRVCPPVSGSGGQGAEEWIRTLILPEGVFHAVVFEKASGRPVSAQDLSTSLSSAHGRVLGKLHMLSRQNSSTILRGRRPWHQERYFSADIASYLPEIVQEPLQMHFQRLRQDVERLPRYAEHWGPVHCDLGYANFFLGPDGSGLEIFDFDNCVRGYYISDIAAALYGSVFTALRCEFPGDRSCFEPPKSGQILEQVWRPFKEGYLSQSPWPEVWNEFLEPWFHILYFRAVVHAFRVRHPITDPHVKAALDADLKLILKDDMPLRFDFVIGMSTA